MQKFCLSTLKDKQLRKIFFQHCLFALIILFYMGGLYVFNLEGIPYHVDPLFVKWDPHPLNLYVVPPIIFFVIFIIFFRAILMFKINNEFLILFFYIFFSILLGVFIAMIDGGGLTILGQPFTRTSYEFFGDVNKVSDPSSFLKNYISLMPSLSSHADNRPPGPILFLWAGSKIFGEGPLVAALWVIIIGNLNIIPLYSLAKDLYSKDIAVYAITLYIFATNVILYSATSMNVIFMLCSTVSICLFYKSINKEGFLYPVLTGLSLAIAVFMTFFDQGIIIFFLVIIAIYYLRRKSNRSKLIVRLMLIPTTFICFYIFLYYLTNFNILDCFLWASSKLKYDIELQSKMLKLHPGSGTDSYLYWLIGKPVAFFLFTGIPISTLYFREIYQVIRRGCKKYYVNIFVIASLISFIVANMFPIVGEVERAWLVMIPLVIIPAASNLWKSMKLTTSSIVVYLTLILLFVQVILFEMLFYTYW